MIDKTTIDRIISSGYNQIVYDVEKSISQGSSEFWVRDHNVVSSNGLIAFKSNDFKVYKDAPLTFNQAAALFNKYYHLDPYLWHKACNFNNNYLHRRSRAFQYVQKIIQRRALWCTLTFSDEVLESTSFETRSKYVKRFLKSHSYLYCANVDYGDLNGREHYHAVIQCDYIDPESWPYGLSKIRKVKGSGTDSYSSMVSSKCISRYIAKLSSHSVKASTKNNRIIYSRRARFDYDLCN